MLLLKQENTRDLTGLIGINDRNLAVIEQELNVSVIILGDEIRIQGNDEDRELAEKSIRCMMDLQRRGESLDPPRVRYIISLVREGSEDKALELFEDVIVLNYRGRPVKCRTLGQMEYIRSIRKNQLTLSVGPAGTGKTYLAVAMAAGALKNREVERIILTRPAVEAGEKLGYLPGDMVQKVDPYLRPLYDALFDMMGPDASQRLTERGVLEVAPLAFMRGRTLANAFIILDEAQNTTPEQMKMFLTRLGEGSRCIVTGDPTQIDLPRGRSSGLTEAVQILEGIPGIGICRLTGRDVVRHELVQRIVEAYAEREKRETDTKQV
ncbi:MAG: PhoH family protein [Clostridia bacterium]|nr:PhoH family protein [Clostridia bacterium]